MYSGHYETSIMELFRKTANSKESLIIFTKTFLTDVCQCPKYVFKFCLSNSGNLKSVSSIFIHLTKRKHLKSTFFRQKFLFSRHIQFFCAVLFTSLYPYQALLNLLEKLIEDKSLSLCRYHVFKKKCQKKSYLYFCSHKVDYIILSYRNQNYIFKLFSENVLTSGLDI